MEIPIICNLVFYKKIMIDPSKVEGVKKLLRKPHVNSTCIGCSACIAVTDGKYFDLDSDCLSTVISCDEYGESEVEDAIASCPVNAISWQAVDASWEYLNGLIEHKDA